MCTTGEYSRNHQNFKLFGKFFQVQPPHESEKIIIRSDHIHHFFFTFLTLLADHISLIFPIIDPDRLHESMTIGKSIPWFFLIDMKRGKAVRAMVSSRSRWMFCYFFFAVKTNKGLISHDKSHRLKVESWRILRKYKTIASYFLTKLNSCHPEAFEGSL